uniref:Uncharacterized protein n=1 Tax=Myripristis murdjan TaxID=586833 RepID=A0A667YAQ5_9TELE
CCLIKTVEEWLHDSEHAFPKQNNSTVSSTTVSPLSVTSPASTTSNPRKSYDNAYFYILFVMFFYFFLGDLLLHSPFCKFSLNSTETADYNRVIHYFIRFTI